VSLHEGERRAFVRPITTAARVGVIIGIFHQSHNGLPLHPSQTRIHYRELPSQSRVHRQCFAQNKTMKGRLDVGGWKGRSGALVRFRPGGSNDPSSLLLVSSHSYTSICIVSSLKRLCQLSIRFPFIQLNIDDNADARYSNMLASACLRL
jgi:hypothetical protein